MSKRLRADPCLTRRHGWAMPTIMAIYKILRAGEWQALLHDGETPGAPIDVTDGYVHFSTAAQCLETANKHFAGETGLWVLAVDETRLKEHLKWEPSRGRQLFPHLYRHMRLSDLIWARPMGRDAKGHALPEGVE